jgi:hypothetical protein
MSKLKDNAKLGIPIIGSNFLLPIDDENLIKAQEKFGETCKIEVVIGTQVIFAELARNQGVCFGDGDTYHFRLTKKKSQTKL